MNSLILFQVFVLLITIIPKIEAEPNPNFHIYLAFGQSNMEGQGEITEELKNPVPNKRFLMLPTAEGANNRTMGRWYDAIPPLAHKKGFAGLMDYFGRRLAKELPEEIKIGAVVVAVSGSNIKLFDKDEYTGYLNSYGSWYTDIIKDYGGNPYQRLVDVARMAKRDGVIKGIFIHQGESNCEDHKQGDDKWPEYIKKVYNDLLYDLNLKAKDVPLLVGELIQTEMSGVYGIQNKYINKLPEILPTAHVVSAEGLEGRPQDNIHFIRESYEILGNRYAEKMLEIYTNKTLISNKSYSGKDDAYRKCAENLKDVVWKNTKTQETTNLKDIVVSSYCKYQEDCRNAYNDAYYSSEEMEKYWKYCRSKILLEFESDSKVKYGEVGFNYDYVKCTESLKEVSWINTKTHNTTKLVNNVALNYCKNHEDCRNTYKDMDNGDDNDLKEQKKAYWQSCKSKILVEFESKYHDKYEEFNSNYVSDDNNESSKEISLGKSFTINRIQELKWYITILCLLNVIISQYLV